MSISLIAFYRQRISQEKEKNYEEIARFAIKIATTVLDPSMLEAYTANGLIPLDKSPSIRLIGIGEVLGRIVGKIISLNIKSDIEDACDPIQVCGSHSAGAEAAIYPMTAIFQADETETVILVDAANAFNSMRCFAALHNIQIICHQSQQSRLTLIEPNPVFLQLGEENCSVKRELPMQGDNLAMAFYSLISTTLISFLYLQEKKNQKCLTSR